MQRSQIKKWEERAKRMANNLEKFEKSNPDFAAWWSRTDFDFAISLREAVAKYGGLTAGQEAAGRKCMAALASIKVAKGADAADRVKEAAPTVNAASVVSALLRAKEAGLKRPKILAYACGVKLSFTNAPANGTNPGAVYVNRNSDWVGKIIDGHYVQVADGEDATEAVRAACNNLVESAVEYGRQTGHCSCCNRELSDPASVAKGIGPICEAKFFG